MVRLALIIAACLMLSACVIRERIVAPFVPPTDRPALAYIGPDDLECLTDSAFERVDANERALIEHAEELETIMQSIRDFGK